MRTRGQLQTAENTISIRDTAANLIDPNARVWITLNRDSAFKASTWTLSRSLLATHTNTVQRDDAGLLYFFNLVNVPLQKKIDAETKKKVNPDLLLPALWYFRWGALLTVIAGLGYFAMYILRPDVGLAKATGANVSGRMIIIVWFFIPVVTFLVEFLIIKKVPALTKDGRVFAVIALILVVAMSIVILKWIDGSLTVGTQHFASNKSLSIGVGC